jgi:hypothetical protein
VGERKIASAADAQRPCFQHDLWGHHSQEARVQMRRVLSKEQFSMIEACERAPCVVSVELEAPNGNRWSAIGGGETLDEAVAFARRSAPDGHDWRVVRIVDLYGD